MEMESHTGARGWVSHRSSGSSWAMHKFILRNQNWGSLHFVNGFGSYWSHDSMRGSFVLNPSHKLCVRLLYHIGLLEIKGAVHVAPTKKERRINLLYDDMTIHLLLCRCRAFNHLHHWSTIGPPLVHEHYGVKPKNSRITAENQQRRDKSPSREEVRTV